MPIAALLFFFYKMTDNKQQNFANHSGNRTMSARVTSVYFTTGSPRPIGNGCQKLFMAGKS
jgi:hypothetical protein